MFGRFLNFIVLCASLAGFLIGCGDGSGTLALVDPTPSASPSSPATPVADPSKTPPPAFDPALEAAHIEYGKLTGTGAGTVKKEWEALMRNEEGNPFSVADITNDRDKVGLFITFAINTDPSLPLEIIKKQVQEVQFQYGLLAYTPKTEVAALEKSLETLGVYQASIKEALLKVAKIYKLKLRDFDVSDKDGSLKIYEVDAADFIARVMGPLITKLGGSSSLIGVQSDMNRLLEKVTLIYQEKDGSENMVSFATFADPILPPPGLWSLIYSFESVFGKNCGGFTSLDPNAVNF